MKGLFPELEAHLQAELIVRRPGDIPPASPFPETPQEWLLWACTRARGQTALAAKIGVSQQMVYGWLNSTKLGVPAEYCQSIEDVTGVPKCKLRPDLFPEFTSITTADGTVIVRSTVTGKTASGRTLEEALAELRRLEAAGLAA